MLGGYPEEQVRLYFQLSVHLSGMPYSQLHCDFRHCASKCMYTALIHKCACTGDMMQSQKIAFYTCYSLFTSAANIGIQTQIPSNSFHSRNVPSHNSKQQVLPWLLRRKQSDRLCSFKIGLALVAFCLPSTLHISLLVYRLHK